MRLGIQCCLRRDACAMYRMVLALVDVARGLDDG